MAAVLLGMAGLDALDLDPEPQPPHREPAQPEEAMRAREGNAVVGANGLGKSELLERALEHAKGVLLLGGGQGIAGQEVAA
jgi:hypothetical protein